MEEEQPTTSDAQDDAPKGTDGPSVWDEMNLSLYLELANVLHLLKAGASLRKKLGRDDGFDKERDFYAKYKRRIVHNKNRNLPMYELIYNDDDGVEMIKTGVPRVLINTYDRKSHEVKSTKDLLYKERLEEILESIHYFNDGDGLVSCHPGGIHSLANKVKDSGFYYKGLYNVVDAFLKCCLTCRLNKKLPMTRPTPPIPIRTHCPHERLQFDLIDMAPEKNRHFMQQNRWRFRYVLAIKCCFSKFCWLFPITTKHARHIVVAADFIFEKEGYPQIWQSDNGSEFVAETVRILCEKNDVKIKHGRPRHPQSQGQIENLNKRVKKHLARHLARKTTEDQAKIWPCLLPGIANVINNTWHATIDDIPFRVYRGRAPMSINQTIVPDDDEFAMIGQLDEQVDDTFDETDLQRIEGETSEDESVCDLEHLNANEFTMSSLYQSCASSSLSKSLMTSTDIKPDVSKARDCKSTEESAEEDCEDEFSVAHFNTSLYAMTSQLVETQLRALESTETMIHRNIERCYKGFPERKFDIGDKILCRNPSYLPYSQQPRARDPLVSMNIEATIVESLPGGMYKVVMENSSEAIEKCLFKGEMVLLENRETAEVGVSEQVNSADVLEDATNMTDNGVDDNDDDMLSTEAGEKAKPCDDKSKNVSRKSILNSIADFAFEVRRSFYGKRTRKIPIKLQCQLQMISEFHSLLDTGAFSSILPDEESLQKQELNHKYMRGIESLKTRNFAFFLYGTVCWERRQKQSLSNIFIKYLAEMAVDKDHSCCSCFLSDRQCDHKCCQETAKDFAKRCGLAIAPKKKRRTEETGKKKADRKAQTKKAKGKGLKKTAKGQKKQKNRKVRSTATKGSDKENNTAEPTEKPEVISESTSNGPINEDQRKRDLTSETKKPQVSIDELLSAPMHATFPVQIKGQKMHIMKVPKSTVNQALKRQTVNKVMLAKRKLTELQVSNKLMGCEKQLAFIIEWLQSVPTDAPSNIVTENCNYILGVLCNGVTEDMQMQISCKFLELDGEQIQVHCQGSSLLCGLCALNNTTSKHVNEFDFFTVNELDNAADELWLLQVEAAEGLSNHTLESMRNLSGNYDVQVLERAAIRGGYLWRRVDLLMKRAFQGYIAAPKESEDVIELYHLVKQSAGIANNDRLLFHNGKDHYQTLVFRKSDLIVIDSISPHVKKLSQLDALSYILRCLHTPLSAVVMITKECDGHLVSEKNVVRITLEDDDVPCGTIDKKFHPISDIWHQKITAADENILVDKTFGDLTVHDVASLKPGNRVNDSILNFCGRALMAHNDHVIFADPMLVERFFLRGFKDLRTQKRHMSMRKEKNLILFPVFDREKKRWTIVFVDFQQRFMGQYDSLGIPASTCVLKTLDAWLSSHRWDISFFRVQSKEEFSSLPVQHGDRMENGIMCICAMICLVERRPMDFSVLDARDIRKTIVNWMAHGFNSCGLSHTLWTGTLDKDEIRNMLKDARDDDDDAEMLLQMCPLRTIACGLGPQMNRFLYIEEKRGKSFKKSFRHVGLTLEELEDFDHWKGEERARTRGRYSWERVDPVLRQWLQQNVKVHGNNHAQTYDDGWVQLSTREREHYWDWCSRLNESLNEEQELF